MQYLPLIHQFSGKACLVVGGGKVALRRAARIADAGGRIDVVASRCLPELADKMTRSSDLEHALALLRCEMTAVHQQFTHILSLRRWGHRDIAERIVEVDDVDFPNAMKIIDYLVETQAPLAVPGDEFQPGHDLPSVMAAEAEMEGRLGRAIEDCRFESPRLTGLLDAAKGPRKEYARWLEGNIVVPGPGRATNPDFALGCAELVGHLLTVVEQAMIHAFVHFHHDRKDLADAVWHTSGAAMMQLTRFVSQCAARDAAMVVEAMPAPVVEYDSELSLQADAELANRCALLAGQAAGDGVTGKVGHFCRELKDYYIVLSEYAGRSVHPAESSNPPAFSSFEATLIRFSLR